MSAVPKSSRSPVKPPPTVGGPLTAAETSRWLADRYGISITARALTKQARTGRLPGACFAFGQRWHFWPARISALIEAGGVRRAPPTRAEAGPALVAEE